MRPLDSTLYTTTIAICCENEHKFGLARWGWEQYNGMRTDSDSGNGVEMGTVMVDIG